MPLSWNDIRSNAFKFVNDWKDETREHAEAKTFWDDFFQVFGVRRRTVASFEEPVKTLKQTYGFIDLFWKGTLLAEHKSAGKDLGRAQAQAMDYIQELKNTGREEEIPRYVAISDFARIALHDLDQNRSIQFALTELPDHIHEFAFIPGYKQQTFDDQDPVNIEAAEIMGRLHDELKAGGYSGEDLERLLVRVLFCLFADDSALFERDTFKLYLENRTAEDASDLGMHLERLFAVLNTPVDQRQSNLDELLADLPYVNGELFAERLGFAEFNRPMRNALLSCARFDWSEISPAVFGSLFQSIMEERQRRQIGAHYTSERDILKVIKPLFLDDLRAEFSRVKRNKNALRKFHARLGTLRFLDPACGCGNFLVIAYRELRQLEIEVLKLLHGKETRVLDVSHLSVIDVDQMFGIEIEEWPARIAEVALWLTDHQMNIKLSEVFGRFYRRLPLRNSPHIVHANALEIDWNDVVPAGECTYILGNPPFVGAKFQCARQKAEMRALTRGMASGGLLDYVTAWYLTAAKYVRGTEIVTAFVSTNSISQGEQVGVLWNELFRRGMKIHFAHRTFPWESEARGKAHVHVVIVGFAPSEPKMRRLFDYSLDGQSATETRPSNISPYLTDGPDTAIVNRAVPISSAPPIGIGNKPIDGGAYLFTPEEKAEFLRIEPGARKYFRRWLGSVEFINGIERWCLWLGDCPPNELRKMPHALERVERVRSLRAASKSAPTRAIANRPTRFHVENFPVSQYLIIPEVSSERRKYIPIGFISPDILASNKVRIVPNASLYQFGLLTSEMHMAWVRIVSGRLKSDFQWSIKLVYNNFPWPANPTDKQRAAVELAAQGVLDARAKYPEATMADLYDPRSMPADLVKAHAALDRAVDRCYRLSTFPDEAERVRFLFERHQQLTTPLIHEESPGRTRRRRGRPQ